jgi:hypothetical protein
MELYFEEESLEISKRGIITGRISLKLGNNVFFPEKEWNDNVIVIINSWIDNCFFINNLKNDKYEIEFNFMDGPFFFKVIKIDDKFQVKFYNNFKEITDMKIFSDYDVINRFRKSLLEKTEKILKIIDDNKWNSMDVDSLERNFILLKTMKC